MYALYEVPQVRYVSVRVFLYVVQVNCKISVQRCLVVILIYEIYLMVLAMLVRKFDYLHLVLVDKEVSSSWIGYVQMGIQVACLE